MPEAAKRGRRLLWVHQNFVSLKQTGIGRATYLIAAMLDAGWHVDLVTSRIGYLEEAHGADLSATLVEREGNLAVHRLGVPQGVETVQVSGKQTNYLDFAKNSLRYVQRTLPRADLIMASSPPLTVMLPPFWLALQWGVPVVLEFRDLWPGMLVEAGLLESKAFVKAMEWTAGYALAASEKVILAASGFEPYARHLGVPQSKIATVPTGADPHYLSLDRGIGGAWRKEQGLENKFIALFAGSMNDTSDVDKVADAAAITLKERPDITWVCAGAGRLKPKLDEAAKTLPNLRLMGALPRNQMPSLYFAADVGLVTRAPWPLEATVYPAKLFDYLAAGLPVISTLRGQPAELLRASGGGETLDDRTPASLARAAMAFADRTSDERKQIGRAGQLWILREMNCYRMAEEMRAILESCVRPPNRLRAWARGIGAGLKACGWTFTGRDPRAIRRATGDQMEAEIHAAFEAWFSRPNAAPSRPADYELPLPEILSGRKP
ncbi:MAG: glycosyltransferase family 4 protein [bacterium]